MKKKIGIVYSSFNNYNLLENEVLKRVEFENYPVINIDDYSSKKNFIYGKKLCNRKKIYFKKNTQKGLQFAVNEGINFLYKKYDCEWIFCLQQDIYPIDKYFFSKFEKSIKTLKNKSIGAIGFNIISDDGIYMNKDIMDTYKKGISPSGFYANSLVFDRSCEFIFNKIDSSWNMTDATRFFYHIKSIKIPLEHRII